MRRHRRSRARPRSLRGRARAAATRPDLHARDPAPARDDAAGLEHVCGIRASDRWEVDDPGAGGVQPGDPPCVWLELLDARGVDPAQAWNAVGLAASLELIQPVELRRIGRDDHLAAALMRDAALLAVLIQLARALDAQARLQRAGHVVDPAWITPELWPV